MKFSWRTHTSQQLHALTSDSLRVVRIGKPRDNDIIKFSSLKGRATCPLLTVCCVAVYEYFINAGLGPLIQFRLPISTLHLTVCCYLFLLCCDVFIYLKWVVPLCLTLSTLLLLLMILR